MPGGWPASRPDTGSSRDRPLIIDLDATLVTAALGQGGQRRRSSGVTAST